MTDYPFSVENKTILVTGASSGIGKEIALVCSRLGAKLVITGRDESRLNDTFLALNGTGHKKIIADITVKADRDRLIAEIEALDGLVHSAGVGKFVPVKFYTEKLIRWFNTINYEAPVLLTNDILNRNKMNDASSIIFISSISSVISIEANGLYSGTKSALLGITRTLALELAVKKIRVNAISPGLVETPLLEFNNAVDKESLSNNIKLHPLGIASPNDVANATVFLLSQASRMITGINLIIDGGYCAR